MDTRAISDLSTEKLQLLDPMWIFGVYFSIRGQS